MLRDSFFHLPPETAAVSDINSLGDEYGFSERFDITGRILRQSSDGVRRQAKS